MMQKGHFIEVCLSVLQEEINKLFKNTVCVHIPWLTESIVIPDLTSFDITVAQLNHWTLFSLYMD